MPTLQLALEEGFLDDHVRVTLDGREVANLQGVSTRVQIGLAQTVEIDMPGDAGALVIELPDKGKSKRVGLSDAPDHLRVSISDSGELETRTSAPEGYA